MSQSSTGRKGRRHRGRQNQPRRGGPDGSIGGRVWKFKGYIRRPGSIKTLHDAMLFFSMASKEFEDGEELMKLLISTSGKRSLAKAAKALDMRSHPEVFEDSLCPFLQRLDREEFTSEFMIDAVGDLLSILARNPAFPSALQHFSETSGDEGKELSSWLVLRLAQRALMDEDFPAPLINHLRGWALILADAGAPKARQLRLLSTSLAWHAGDRGRHDSNPISFRQVPVIPTREEILCAECLCLPGADLPFGTPHREAPDTTDSGGGAGGEGFEEEQLTRATEALLDKHFRLLREDFIGPLRQRLRNRNDWEETKERIPTGCYCDVQIEEINCDEERTRSPSLMVSFRFPPNHEVLSLGSRKATQEYWRRGQRGDRILPKGSLVALFDSTGPKLLAMVAERESKGMARTDANGDPHPQIGLEFFGPAFGSRNRSMNDVASILLLRGLGVQEGLSIVEVCSSFFAYEPVLRALQRKTTLPMAEEIAQGAPSRPPSYVDFNLKTAIDDVAYLRGPSGDFCPLEFDESQRASLELALSTRVALIQGPPGTGKTFLGSKLAEIILKRSGERIMVLAHTNHAVDDFLTSLIQDGGITDIVRFGKASKPEVEPYTLAHMEQDRFHSPGLFGALREDLRDSLSSARRLAATSSSTWSSMASFLEEQHPDAYEQLANPPDSSDDGYQLVGEGGRTATEDYFWDRWTRGECRNPQRTGDGGSLWQLSVEMRMQQVQTWREEIGLMLARRLCECKDASTKLEQLDRQKSIACLKSRRVIGITTTSAAKHQKLLVDAKPSVLIVEEAGEVLEAHILACLSDSVKHLIMIGDHQQLRPKIENYELSVSNGKTPHQLDISLFERLIVGGMIYGRLVNQHRMRPEICDLIRSAYACLTDAPKTREYADIPFLAKNVVFVDHEENETGTSTAKENAFEVELVYNIVAYLLRNGVARKDIVVLTPYAAQLRLLRANALCKNFHLLLSDSDAQEVAELGSSLDVGEDSTLDTAEGEGIRGATIDNFQGEEADFVVVSLVRSNDNYNIGFLSEVQRVNVLLSRARRCEILVGNSIMFKYAECWKWRFKLLRERGQIFKGLPVRCIRHKREPPKPLRTSEDFERYAPNGGCDEPCDFNLGCGHVCPLRCHHPDDDHSTVRCTAIKSDKCRKGHDRLFPCGSPLPAGKCKMCYELQKRAAERRKKSDPRRKALLQMQEQLLEAETERADVEAEQASLAETGQLRQGLEDARIRLSDSKAQLRRKKAQLAALEASASDERCKGDLASQVDSADADREHKDCALHGDKKSVSAEEDGIDGGDNSDSVLSTGEEGEPKAPNLTETADAFARWHAILELEWSSQSPEVQHRVRSLVKETSPSALETLFSWEGLPNLRLASVLKSVASKAFQPPIRGKLRRVVDLTRELEWIRAYREAATLDDSRLRSVLMRLCAIQLESDDASEVSLTRVLLKRTDCFGQEAALEHLLAASAVEAGRFRQENCLTWFSLLFFVVSTCSSEWGAFLKLALAQLRKVSGQAGLKTRASPERVSAKDLRQRLKAGAGSCEPLHRLIDLIGLTEVKEKMLEVRYKAKLDRERDLKDSAQHNAIFLGNPGTGKTTVARIYGEILSDLEILPGREFQEVSGAKLVQEGVSALTSLLDEITEKGGGILFIDEAYQLQPQSSAAGRLVLDLLLTEVENKRDVLAVVLAGYKEDMQAILQYNDGLASRFRHRFEFCDFSDNELCEILLASLEAGTPKWTIDDPSCARIAAKRLGRQRGTKGFGNARAVRNFLEDAKERQAKRLYAQVSEDAFPKGADAFHLAYEDLFGCASFVREYSEAYQELRQLQGLKSVKEGVEQLIQICETNLEREKLEQPLAEVNLNRLFLGNPGTGKTTVAGIYGRLLRELGLLSKGEVICKTPGDFIGSALGQSEQRTKGILKESLGCVLVIDEAYSLAPAYGANGSGTDPYRSAVVDTLVAEVQGRPGEDRCVLMLGYQAEMESFIRNANPGLQRRFQSDRPYIFEDYDDEALLQILNRKLSKKHLSANLQTKLGAIDLLSRERMKPNFGNGGAVENLIGLAVSNAEIRRQGLPSAQRARDATLVLEDFVGDVARELAELRENPMSLFDDILDAEDVLEKFRDLVEEVQDARRRGRDPREDIEFTYKFVGPPGTGKTTVARRIGKLFWSLDLLPSCEFKEVRPSDFSTGFVGQAAGKAREIFREALGGVLFIDEAYGLYEPNRSGGFMKEAVDEIVAMLTDPDFMKKVVVVFAGYEEEIEDMLSNVNQGLKSRVKEAVRFQAFKPEKVARMMRKGLEEKGFAMAPEAEATILTRASSLCSVQDFASGRDVQQWCQATCKAARRRAKEEKAEGDLIFVSDVDLERSLETLAVNKNRGASLGPSLDNPEDAFEGLVECSSILEMARRLADAVEFEKQDGRDPRQSIPMTFKFIGPPGTGKTEVARRMGEFFRALKVLPGAKLVSKSATEFGTGYAGQAGQRTREIFRQALGGVLFIDEAYRFYDGKPGGCMSEAVDEIVQLLTEEEFKGKLVVIFAGYEAEMEVMLRKVNPGLRSRLQETLRFEPWGAQASAALLRRKIEERGWILEESADLESLFDAAVRIPDWASGRDIQTLFMSITLEYAKDRKRSGGRSVTSTMLQHAFSKLLAERSSGAVLENLSNAPEAAEAAQAAEAAVGAQHAPARDTASSGRICSTSTELALVCEDRTQEPEAECDGDGSSGDDVLTLLEKAVKELGYDDSHETRKRLVETLEAASRKGSIPSDILEYVMKHLPMRPEAEVTAKLLPQVPVVLSGFQNAVKAEEERLAELERLAEEERKQEEERYAKKQAKLRSMGICPAGFEWFREGDHWRCGGGSHTMRDDQV